MASAENVISLGNAIRTDRKQAWLDQAAQAYDAFVEEHSREPEARLLVFIAGNAWKVGWDIGLPWSEVPGSGHGLILMASEALRAQVGNTNDL